MDNILKPSPHPKPILKPSEVSFVDDFANASAQIAVVNTLCEILLNHQDPTVVAACRALQELCVDPWRKCVAEIHTVSPTVPDVYKCVLSVGELSIGDHSCYDISIRQLPGKFAKITVDEEGKALLELAEPVTSGSFELKVIRGLAWGIDENETLELRRSYRDRRYQAPVEIRAGDHLEALGLVHINILSPEDQA